MECPFASMTERIEALVRTALAGAAQQGVPVTTLTYGEVRVCRRCDLLLAAPLCPRCGPSAATRPLRSVGLEGRKLEDLPDLLTEAELAQWLGVEPSTVQSWRYDGLAPEYIRLGRSKNGPVRYDHHAVRRFLEARRKSIG